MCALGRKGRFLRLIVLQGYSLSNATWVPLLRGMFMFRQYFNTYCQIQYFVNFLANFKIFSLILAQFVDLFEF